MKQIPILYSIFLLALILYSYLTFTDYPTRVKAIIISCFYSLIEYSWTGSTIELPNGELIFKPFDKRCRKPHTVNKFYILDYCSVPFECNFDSLHFRCLLHSTFHN